MTENRLKKGQKIFTMVIDFHTHTFPAKIAGKALSKLSAASHSRYFTDGTDEALAASMKEAGIAVSVILPVATSEAQVRSINDSAARLMETRRESGLISFGAMHPDYADWKEELIRIRDLGFKGIKVHPLYQGADLDDPRYLRILSRCAELDLAVVTHGGLDVGIPGVVHASPRMELNAMREVTGTRSRTDQGGRFALICAHMGGWKNWDEVLKLAPEMCAAGPFMIDTSFALDSFAPLPDGYWTEEETRMLDRNQFTELVRCFGAERVVFATDSPWSSQSASVDFVRSAGLTDAELGKILFENAAALLGIPFTATD